MRQGARIKAAIEIIGEILKHHRPASLALADWGKAHRFAGSGDRAAVGNLVYDVMRRRLSLAAQMQSDKPRGLTLAAAPLALAMTAAEIAAAADGSAYAADPLTEKERDGLARGVPPDAPDWTRADVPEWLWPSFERTFGGAAVQEGAALAARAPVDLRANTLAADRDKVLETLARFKPKSSMYAPHGIRLPAPEGGKRQANVEAETSHGRGWFEVQDEGSQIAAALTGAASDMQVLDFCAGAGGKTLALAAMMQNAGQIHAYDSDKVQLRPIFERLTRAGVKNVEVIDAGDHAALNALGAKFDIVLVDAPCTGSGVWRRRPDSKWRVKPANITQRQADQKKVLNNAVRYIKPGGRLVYVTCSVLAEENSDTVDWLIQAAGDLKIEPYPEVWRATIGSEPPASADGRNDTLLLTPATHGTDGFFIAILRKST